MTFAPPRDLYPFRSNWHEQAGSRLHYLDEGSGPAVLMLHGNPTWSFLYRSLITELRATHRCIVPDYPGFGLSDLPPEQNQTPQEHARRIDSLIRDLDLESFVLVGHDWGGPIGLSLAVQYPGRVDGVVLANTWCWEPDWWMGLFSRLWGGPLGKYLCLNHNGFARWMIPLGVHHRDRLTPEIREAYVRPLDQPERRRGTWAFPRSIRRASDWVRRTEDRLTKLRSVPVHLVWGMKDPAFGWNPYLDQWNQRFPQAEVIRLNDASHYVPEDRPGALVRATLELNQP